MRFAVMLKKLRKAMNVTQADLAKYSGVSPQTVSRWESGESFPDTSLIPFIAVYFHVSTDYLLGVADGPSTCVLLRTTEEYEVVSPMVAKRMEDDMRRQKFPKLVSLEQHPEGKHIRLTVVREYGPWEE